MSARRATNVIAPRVCCLTGSALTPLLQPVQNRIKVQPAAVPYAINKQSGSCIDSVYDAASEVFAHSLLVGTILKVLAESLGVQPKLLGIPIKIFALKRGLTFE